MLRRSRDPVHQRQQHPRHYQHPLTTHPTAQSPIQQYLDNLYHELLSLSEGDVILAVLTLVDLSLVANLLLIVIFSGYENFVSKIHTEAHEDRPEWMGKVDFSGLKLKLVASIVAISGIELLKAFVNIGGYTNTELAWKVGIHGMLVVSGVLLALMDRIAASAKH